MVLGPIQNNIFPVIKEAVPAGPAVGDSEPASPDPADPRVGGNGVAVEAAGGTAESPAEHDEYKQGKNQDGRSGSGGSGRKEFVELTPEEQKLVRRLQKRDREVRAHEQAHKAAGGRYAGGASYEYETGPDGKKYAVGGEVSISAGSVSGDPKATAEKARTIRRAALAPAQPSAQDRQVAARAAAMEAKAEADLARLRLEESEQAKLQAEADQQAQTGDPAGKADWFPEQRHAPPPIEVRLKPTSKLV